MKNSILLILIVILMIVDYKVNDDDVQKFGILELNWSSMKRIAQLSRFSCPYFYFLHKNSFDSRKNSCNNFKDNPNPTINDRNATEKFLAWIINNKKFKTLSEFIQCIIDVGGLQG